MGDYLLLILKRKEEDSEIVYIKEQLIGNYLNH